MVVVVTRQPWRRAAWTWAIDADASGTLSTSAPVGDQTPESFRYDPADPVPTIGGPNLLSDSEAAYQTGPWDQSELDARKDVLRFTTPSLEEPLTVIGEISVRLWAATSARDTDWTAKLIDVWPDGRAINICDGIIRARHRLSVEESLLPEPGEPYDYVIDLVATAYVFARDHRLRIDISSSNFPRFDVNPGTGESMADASSGSYGIAEQRVYVDEEHPSRLTLPLLPRSSRAEP